MDRVRPCTDSDRAAVLGIVNAAAEAYRGVIPGDRWQEPYMSQAELDDEIGAGVYFWGLESERRLVGVMGLQAVREVELIRHAYVAPAAQRRGVGSALLEHLVRFGSKPMLVGTWAAAAWAIRFYESHGFELVSPAMTASLLKEYWTIPDRQVETSVVLANPPLPDSLMPQ